MTISLYVVKQIRVNILEQLSKNPPDKFRVSWIEGVFLIEDITSFNYIDGLYHLNYGPFSIKIEPRNIDSFFIGK